MSVLLTGATGFVGTHIYAKLVSRGLDVVCATRDPEAADKRFPNRRWVGLDLADRISLHNAMSQVDRGIYLAHSMADDGDYLTRERHHAETFRGVAVRENLERIVYLGGMRRRGRFSGHL